MTGAISKNADLVEKIGNLGREQSLELQATKKVGLGFFAGLKQPRLCGDKLREKLAELPQLDETGIGIVVKIALGKRAQAHELDVVRLEESEIALVQPHTERIPLAGPCEFERSGDLDMGF
jgi:hypothetical protein